MLPYGGRKAPLTTTLMALKTPDNVLAAAEQVQLRDLLDSPTFLPWIVSALSNALNVAYDLGNLTSEDDQFLQFKLKQLVRAIPYETRRECFSETARMIRERKEARK